MQKKFILLAFFCLLFGSASFAQCYKVASGELIIEGSSLMAVELLGAKLLTPFTVVLLYVWTAVLCITVPEQVLVADMFKNGAGAAINDLMLFINQYDQVINQYDQAA